MPQYLISMYQPASGEIPPPEVLQRVMAEIAVINDDLRAQDAWVWAGGLQPPSTASVVRLENGEAVTTDGPFLELKEQIGGFTIINAPDMETALGWGRRMAKATTLPTEVRPFQG